MHWRLYVAMLALFFSCSILEDSDITSSDQFKKLNLKSIEITQTVNGNSITKIASVKTEAIDESSSIGKLTKRVTISWPTFEDQRFRFRSGVTDAITIIGEYGADDKIKFWRVKSSGTIAETYMFIHNSDGTLNTLKSFITVDGIVTTNTDPYSTDILNFPTVRNLYSADPTIKKSWGGPVQSVTPCGFSLLWQYDLTCPTGTPQPPCVWQNKKEYYYCNQDNFYILNKEGSQVGRSTFSTIESDLLEEVFWEESLNNNTCCGDQFYFHPYLFMKVDPRIRIMYAPDWWKEDSNFNGETNQSVKLKFRYEL